jgi:hypothetical protein
MPALAKNSPTVSLGGLTPWADVSDDHGLLLTSAGWVGVLVNNSTEPSGQHYMDITTIKRGRSETAKGNVCLTQTSRLMEAPLL